MVNSDIISINISGKIPNPVCRCVNFVLKSRGVQMLLKDMTINDSTLHCIV